MTPLHRAARRYAAAGIPVFPCREGAKEPATANGFKDATCDLVQIDAWWGENPNFNLALSPQDAGWCVIDLDPPVGIENWNALARELGVPDTRTIETPRGGLHLYFDGELPSSASKIGEDIDTRGRGGYVLVPPSLIDGKLYKSINGADNAVLPEWVAAKLESASVAVKAAVTAEDLPANVARARSLLRGCVARGDVAVEGAGGNSRTYSLACELLNLGLSSGMAQSLLEELWNPSCTPPWPSEELDTIFSNASRYAQNEPGAWGVGTAAEAFGTALDKLAPASPQDRRSRFYPEDESEQEQGKDPAWLVRDLMQEASTNLWMGPTQSYKSFLALDLALSVAAGVTTFGSVPAQQGLVFYAAAEGRSNIKRARRRAWKLAHEIDTPIPGFYVMPAPMISMDDEVQEFGDQIAARCKDARPLLIVLDTLSKCMAGLNENDARDAGRFVRFCDSLVETFGCCVLAIHHTGKDDGRGARGSSAFQAGFDSVVEIKARRDTKAVEAWVRKHKDAEERTAPFTFEGRNLGPSLAFFPTSHEQHRMLTEDDNAFDPHKVGAALQALKAYGDENGVSTRVLATAMLPPIESEGMEVREGALAGLAKKLGAMSRARLRAYCSMHGNGIRWHLPAQPATH